VEDKTIVIIINLVSSRKPMAQDNVVITLENLTVNDDMVRWEIMKEDGIQPLLKLMDNAIGPRQQGGMGTLCNQLVLQILELSLLQGFFTTIHRVLESEPVNVQHIATTLICYMASS
jgi:hypothetical protein